jgi:hypothetical protein
MTSGSAARRSRSSLAKRVSGRERLRALRLVLGSSATVHAGSLLRSSKSSVLDRRPRCSSQASVAAAQPARSLLDECRRPLPGAHRARRLRWVMPRGGAGGSSTRARGGTGSVPAGCAVPGRNMHSTNPLGRAADAATSAGQLHVQASPLRWNGGRSARLGRGAGLVRPAPPAGAGRRRARARRASATVRAAAAASAGSCARRGDGTAPLTRSRNRRGHRLINARARR